MKMKPTKLFLLPLATLPFLFASCEERTEAEKAGDAIEEAGEEVGDAIEDATN